MSFGGFSVADLLQTIFYNRSKGLIREVMIWSFLRLNQILTGYGSLSETCDGMLARPVTAEMLRKVVFPEEENDLPRQGGVMSKIYKKIF